MKPLQPDPQQEMPSRIRDDGHSVPSSTAPSRLSKFAVALVILLFIDLGFVLVESSRTAGTVAMDLSKEVPASVQAAAPTTLSVSVNTATPAATQPAHETPTTSPTASPTPVPTQILDLATSEPTVTLTQAPTPTDRITLTATALATSTLSVSSTTQLSLTIGASGCAETTGKLITDTITSRVLGHALPVQIYLPPCYDSTRFTYPALYLIQGSAFTIGEWAADGVTQVADREMSAGSLPPFIIVMPASDLDYGDSSVYTYSSGGKGSWEDFMINDLIPVIESKYGAWPSREGRAIGGISRGGYWSLEIGFTHSDLFAAIGGHSPSITADELIGAPANFSMVSYIRSLDLVKTTRIFLDAGSTDWAQRGVTQLTSDLDARGITYTVSSGEGGHDDTYWASRIPDYLAFYSANWPHTAPARPARAGNPNDNQQEVDKP